MGTGTRRFSPAVTARTNRARAPRWTTRPLARGGAIDARALGTRRVVRVDMRHGRHREKQQKSPDKAPAAVSPAPAPPAFYEALDDVADELRASVQNLHVDVLRQFQIQKSEVAALLEAHESRIAELLRENAGLRRENEELRLPW